MWRVFVLGRSEAPGRVGHYLRDGRQPHHWGPHLQGNGVPGPFARGRGGARIWQDLAFRRLLRRKRRRSMRRSFLSWLRVPRLDFRDHRGESGTRLSVSASFPLTLGRSEFPAAPCPTAGGRPIPSVELKGPALRGCARGENREVWGRLSEESHAAEGEKEESGGCKGWGGGGN